MFIRFVHSVQYSSFFQIAIGEARVSAMAQIMGTQISIALKERYQMWLKVFLQRLLVTVEPHQSIWFSWYTTIIGSHCSEIRFLWHLPDAKGFLVGVDDESPPVEGDCCDAKSWDENWGSLKQCGDWTGCWIISKLKEKNTHLHTYGKNTTENWQEILNRSFSILQLKEAALISCFL